MSVIEASVDDLPFADSSFDVVTTVESFYFWPNPECDLAEVWRVLRPGGRFLLVADIYDKPDLPADASENIEKYQLTVLTPEGYMSTSFINRHSDKGFKRREDCQRHPVNPIDVAFIDEAHLLLTQGNQGYIGNRNQLLDIMGVTDKFEDYARPLIGGEISQVYIGGIPRHIESL